LKNCLHNWGNNQLGNAQGRGYSKWLVAKVGEDNLDFAPVIGIDSSGAVKNGNTVFESQTRAWANLGFIPKGESYRQASGNKGALAWINNNIFFNAGT
jgi:hypothetical protein